MNFRSDINGLRALAVLAVLAFHFGIPGFGGGFVGVDVFFVISGYLMTGIIVGRIDRDTFSILDFYLDRGRRIIPPLIVMVAVLMAGGLIWLLPQDLLALGKHAASAVTFLSNMLFWTESGYFAPSAKLNWLLHTWSLSVEWQFYIIYPLLILALRQIGERRFLIFSLTALAVLSFALSVYLTGNKPSAAFFLLPPRAWEMMTGALIFLIPPLPSRFARSSQLVGLAAIIASVLFANETHWPGLPALVPVLGAALLIAARRTESRITGNQIVSWVGLNSYSIYLWHWPIAVFIDSNDLTGNWCAVLIGFLLSLVLGHISWRLVERGGQHGATQPKVHTSPENNRWQRHVILLSLIGVLAIAGAGIWKARGLPSRFSPEVQALEADTRPGGAFSKGCFAPALDKPPCIIGPNPHHIAAVVIGDSHADADVSAVVAALPPDMSIAWSGNPACPPLLGGFSTDPENRCAAFLQHDLAPLTQPRIIPVILISHWNGVTEARNMVFGDQSRLFSLIEFRRHLIDTSCALAKAGPTYVMLSTPDFPVEVASTLQHRLVADPHSPDITIPLADHVRRLAAVNAMWREAASQCGVHLLDPIPYVCPDRRTCMGSIHHRAIFRDTHHMTEFGNKLLVPMFRRVFVANR